MPVAQFDLGNQVATADLAPRHLIPGVEPGGSRVGQPTKPALLLRNAWIEIQDLGLFGQSDTQVIGYFLKLSQEPDLNPGILLPVAKLVASRIEVGTAVNQFMMGSPMIHELFHAQGTVWAPSYVGCRVVESGGAVTVADVDIFLSYERVDIPWMDWFLLWDFLDNVGDNERES